MAEKIWRYTAPLEKNPDMDAGYVVFPWDLRREVGRGRLRVRALFDGVPYEGSIVNMGVRDGDGNIVYVIGVPRRVRALLGKDFGDTLSVEITPAPPAER